MKRKLRLITCVLFSTATILLVTSAGSEPKPELVLVELAYAITASGIQPLLFLTKDTVTEDTVYTFTGRGCGQSVGMSQ